MRAFVGWMVMVLVSVGLGLGLYSTSLQGSTSEFQEAAFVPGPTSTVVKTRTKTKVVRKPAKTKVVYVPQAPAPAATVYVPQQSSGYSSGSNTGTARVQSDSHSGDDDSDD